MQERRGILCAMKLDWSQRSRLRVIGWTVLGVVAAVAITLAIDWSYINSVEGSARTRAIMVDTMLPTILAGPAIYLLTSKIRQLALMQEQLEHLATTDSLTGLLNRGAFTGLVRGVLADRRQPYGGRGALLVVDADHFKRINDNLGHAQGDAALRIIASAISGAVRDGDMVGRLGGEEFGVFLPGADESDAAHVAERIREAISDAEFTPEGLPFRLSVSVGGVTYRGRSEFDELFRLADQRLYAAKDAGRDRVSIGSAEQLEAA